MSPPPGPKPEFDEFAEQYDDALSQGLAVTGETKDYYARGRVEWLAKRMREEHYSARNALDFGTGTGTSTPLLLDLPGVESVVGVDVSPQSIQVARRLHPSPGIRFVLSRDFKPGGEMDLAFCNGVFHHIPPAERLAPVRLVFESLRPGGWFSLWENNPWNPGTRYVMSRVPFDRDAILLAPPATRRMLRDAGFEIVETDFLFFFPRHLSWFRGLEPALHLVPLGGQYQVLAQRPM